MNSRTTFFGRLGHARVDIWMRELASIKCQMFSLNTVFQDHRDYSVFSLFTQDGGRATFCPATNRR